MNSDSSFEMLRREISRLFAIAAVMTVIFALEVAVHLVLARLIDLSAPGAYVQRVLYFAELALFGSNAFIAIVVLVNSSWRIVRALLTRSPVGAKS